MANDGSSPACCSATVSIEVVEVLPCVPATRRDAAAGHQRGQRLRPPHHRQAALAGREQLGVVSRTAVDTTTVGVRRAASGSPRRGRRTRAPSARRARTARRILGVRPGDRHARGRAGCGRSRSSRRRRCRPGGRAPASPGRRVRRCRHGRRRPRRPAPAARRRSSRVGVAGCRAPALPAASSRAASPSSGISSASTRSPVSSASGDQHAAARGDDRLGVEPLLAVAVRQRHVHRGQADGRRSRRRSSPPTRPAPRRPRRRPGPCRSMYGRGTYAAAPGIGAACSAAPWACSTRDPRPRRARAAPRRPRR